MLVLGATFTGISVYSLYRMAQRPTVPKDETESYLSGLPARRSWRSRPQRPGPRMRDPDDA
ncbi:MAG: hypothetical protein HUJ24_09025 [Rhodobacteraceae bacterium]|nr:hypothetical protein [Paracoccaceae bacterium]